MRFVRGLGVASASTFVLASVPLYVFLDLPPHLVPEMAVRSLRTLYAGAMVSLDYKRLPDDETVEGIFLFFFFL